MLLKLKFNWLLSIAFATISIVDCGYAQIAGGGYSQSYMLRNVGARAIAMAGAYSALADEPNALFYNPAGLKSISDQPTFSSMYSFLDFGRTQGSLVWGQSFFEDFGFGLGINNYTTGSFVARDVKGNPIGNFTDWNFNITGGAAYSIEFATIGASVKYLSNSLEGSGSMAEGFGVDIGAEFDVMGMFNFGVSVQNFASMMFWNTQSEESNLLPYTIRTGVGMQFGLNDNYYVSRSSVSGELEEVYEPATRYLLIGIDALLTQYENSPTFVIGGEVVAHEVIAFRGGIALAGDDMGEFVLFPMSVWGAGLSLRPDDESLGLPFKVHFDYTISNDILAINAISHHLSLFIQFKGNE